MTKLEKLKQEFDRVLVKYDGNTCHALLVKDLDVFTGTSKCHEKDSYNKKLGRRIALGRAEFAYKVSTDEAAHRISNNFTAMRLGSKDAVDGCITSFLKKF